MPGGPEPGHGDRALAHAIIEDAQVISAGDLVVTADNLLALESSVTNEALSEALGFTAASGQAASFVLSSNLVAGGALALLQSTGATL
uniref:hypothetical protein n=1 Tax=Verrucomicrobium spinosum TaxID=2736 RepID=UPI000AB96A20